MADVPLAHLSRQQLVHLLLRIVDLLAQPVVPCQSATPAMGCTGGPTLEPYDASLDPWNAPDPGLSVCGIVKVVVVGALPLQAHFAPVSVS